MSTVKWGSPETLQSYLTTQLDALANSTTDTTGFSASGSEINNEVDKFQYIDFELFVNTQGVARSTGAFVEIWAEVAVDNTPTYPDRANLAFTSGLVTSIQLDAAVTARRLTLANIPIPPYKTKFYVRNGTGQAFGASGSTLKYRRHNEDIIT